MADIDPNAIPFVPPANVTLIDTAEDELTARPGGKPTTAFHDWLTSLWSWMKRTVVDLTTKITTVESSTDDAHARITTEIIARTSADEALASQITTIEASVGDNAAAIVDEATARATADSAMATQITSLTATVSSNTAAIVDEATARADGDSALALSITTVDAKANNATASGAMYLAATSTPSGATAAYGWHLTAGNSYAGFSAIALSGGGSAIGMTATQLRFVDSGTAQQVFGYSSGVFTFQVPVVIQSGTSGARQVITNENTKIYDSGNVLRVAIGINI